MSVRLAGFDCDGTLGDGQAAVCDSMEVAFAEVGLPQPDRNAVRRIVGLSLLQAVRQLVPEAEHETTLEVVEAYKASFRATRESGALREPLYPGIRETLHALRDAGWSLAVATGKSDRGLIATLAANDLSDLFGSGPDHQEPLQQLRRRGPGAEGTRPVGEYPRGRRNRHAHSPCRRRRGRDARWPSGRPLHLHRRGRTRHLQA